MKPGDLIGGKYRLVRQIGEGAMGVVWSAVNESTTREVALKLVLRSSDDLRHRLLREARACGKLSHRNIIEVYDVGQTESGDPFLVMQLLSGETVAELLERQRRLDPPLAAQIGRDVARALAAAHAAQIIHRDLKPANIFLHKEAGTEGTVVKVLDFGVCKSLDAAESVATVAGGLVGSPAFMSPEQVRMVPDLDHRTDIWSLGVALFKMLTGVLPFQGTAQEVIQKILAGEIPVVSRLVRFVDPGLVQVVSRCMERDRSTRIALATDLAEQLQRFASSESSRVFMEIPQQRAASISSPTMQAVVPDGDAETLRLNPAMAAGIARLRQGQAAPVQGTSDRRSQGDAPATGAAIPPAAFGAPYGSSPVIAPPAMPQPMAATQKLPPDSPWCAAPASAQHGVPGGLAPTGAQIGATPLPSERARDSSDYPRGGTIKMVTPSPAELAAALPRQEGTTSTAALVQSAAASTAAHPGGAGAHPGASGVRPWRVAVAIALISMLVTVSGGLIYTFVFARRNAAAIANLPGTTGSPAAPAPPEQAPLAQSDTASALPITPPSGTIAAGPADSAAPATQVPAPISRPSTAWVPQSQSRATASATPSAVPTPTPTATAPAVPATLHMSSVPRAKVMLDGRMVGETPLLGFRVPPGEHVVSFIHPQFGTKSVRIILEPGQTKMAKVTF